MTMSTPEGPKIEDSITSGATRNSGDGMVLLVNTVADRIEPVLKLVTTVMERSLESQQQHARFRTHMAWIAVAVVALIVCTAAWLTYLGKIDGATMGFLLGLVVGYVLTFIRDAITPPSSE